jgi:hypothetical protein
VRGLRLLDALVGVIDDPPPFSVVHECSALGFTWRKLRWAEIGKRLAGNTILGLVISLLADSIEIEAEGICGWVATNPAVPTIVVPSDPDVQVVNHSTDPMRSPAVVVLDAQSPKGSGFPLPASFPDQADERT